jgi:hypothetical protein
MPLFNYVCTASVVYNTLEDGSLEKVGHETHPIEIPQERIDAREGFRHDGTSVVSKMGLLASPPGEPPRALECLEHDGWAILADQ